MMGFSTVYSALVLCVLISNTSGYEIDEDIASNIAEGEALLKDINTFMDNPSVPQSLKVSAFNNEVLYFCSLLPCHKSLKQGVMRKPTSRGIL